MENIMETNTEISDSYFQIDEKKKENKAVQNCGEWMTRYRLGKHHGKPFFTRNHLCRGRRVLLLLISFLMKPF
jgi:hypothetical protein